MLLPFKMISKKDDKIKIKKKHRGSVTVAAKCFWCLRFSVIPRYEIRTTHDGSAGKGQCFQLRIIIEKFIYPNIYIISLFAINEKSACEFPKKSVLLTLFPKTITQNIASFFIIILAKIWWPCVWVSVEVSLMLELRWHSRCATMKKRAILLAQFGKGSMFYVLHPENKVLLEIVKLKVDILHCWSKKCQDVFVYIWNRQSGEFKGICDSLKTPT